VQAVGVQVQRRRFQLRGVQRDVGAGGGVGRVVVVLDGQAGEVVVVVDDQAFARVDPQGGRGIFVVALRRSVRAGALDELVAEHQEVRHRLFDGVEIDGGLVRGEPDLQHAVLAGELDRLAVVGGFAVDTGVDTGLRRRIVARARRRHRHDHHRDDEICQSGC
jgi:hypothetical protein